MLVARYAEIAKLSLDTLQFKIFIREPGGWIKAVDYHYWYIKHYSYIKWTTASYKQLCDVKITS